ncbi:MAG: hypothetical protein ACKVWV_04820 [Planctomycetota bacterium]
MRAFLQVLVSASALIVSSRVHADVLVVNGAGGTPWQSIQAAVDAASDGDTILVKRGVYRAFQIVSKGVRVFVDRNHSVQVFGKVVVADLAAAKTVVIAGLEMNGAPLASGTQARALELWQCSGAVRVQDCRVLAGPDDPLSCDTASAVSVDGCLDVAFVHCTFEGASAHATRGGKGGTGISSELGSSVAVYDAVVRGGAGDSCNHPCSPPQICPHPLQDDWCPNSAYPDGAYGGDAFEGGSFLFASNSQFTGGVGGNSEPSGNYLYGGNGGDGIRACSFGTNVWTLDIDAEGGLPGHSGPAGFYGTPGTGMRATNGAAANSMSGVSRTLAGANVVRANEPLALQFFGEPGDEVHLFIGSAPGFHLAPALRGVKLVHDARRIRIGQIGASGLLAVDLQLAGSGSGATAKTHFLQSLHGSTDGRATLGSALTVIVVDASI